MDMDIAHTFLPDYLVHALLDALRRDLRREEAERTCAPPGSDDAYLHGLNVRLDIELLQYLKPRTGARSSYRPGKRQRPGMAASNDESNASLEFADD